MRKVSRKVKWVAFLAATVLVPTTVSAADRSRPSPQPSPVGIPKISLNKFQVNTPSRPVGTRADMVPPLRLGLSGNGNRFNSTNSPSLNKNSTIMSPSNSQKKNNDASYSFNVCGSLGAGGGNVKGCIGTGGFSFGGSVGAGLSAGVSKHKDWSGKTMDCATVTGTVGAGPMATGSLGVCTDAKGQTYSRVSVGGGLGVGTDGLKAGLTVEPSRMEVIKKNK